MFRTTILIVCILSPVLTEKRKAVSVIQGKGVSGTLHLVQEDNYEPVVIKGSITGLTEGEHGFHIHEKGDLTNGCTSTGSHFNPDSKKHGAPYDKERHGGDLGNIKANKDGFAEIDIIDNVISLHGRRSVIGRAFVVHSDSDDIGRGGFNDSLSTGHAGSRVACGIIGIQ